MKKEQTSNRKNTNKTSKDPRLFTNVLWNLMKDSRVHYLFGALLFLFSVYLFISFTLFITSEGVFDRADKIGNINNDVVNATGPLGDTLSLYFINGWIGIGAYFIVLALIFISIRIFRKSKFPIFNKLLWCLLGAFWTSLFFGYFFQDSYNDTFLFLGGRHGYYMSIWFQSIFGSLGTLFIVIFILLASIMLASKRSLLIAKNIFDKVIHYFKPHSYTSDDNNIEVTKGEKNDVSSSDSLYVEKDTDTEIEEETYIPIPIKGMVVNPMQEEEEIQGEEVGTKSVKEEDTPIELQVTHIIDEISPEDGTYTEKLEDYDPTLDLSTYQFPSLQLLKEYPTDKNAVSEDELLTNKNRIEETLGQYGIKITSITASIGPTITLYEIIPAPGVKISKIKNLEDDIALSLAALGIRIIAPMPGKGTVGIEVPNRTMEIVSMHSILKTRKFQESSFDLPIALGRTITNETYMVDLCKMPHMLMAGATGQGKSVGLNAIVTSLLYKKHPSQLKFVFIDPKKVEFSIYSKIEKHYLAKLPDTEDPIITDVHKSVQTLNSITAEMDQRYDLLKKAHVRNIKEYNSKFIGRKLNPNNGHKYLPYIVVIVDEYGDLIMTAGKEVELPIARIAQLARAVGIHMIIATQRPSANIITGIIKANFPARVSFRVSSMVDSRTILDASGANQLIGRGDMLISTGNEMIRVQCAFVDTPEVEAIVKFIGEQRGYPTAFMLPEAATSEDMMGSNTKDVGVKDELFEEAARLIVAHQQGSTSLIQRRFSIGYNRAGRIIDQLESCGIIGPFEGSKARQVLVQDEATLERLLNAS